MPGGWVGDRCDQGQTLVALSPPPALTGPQPFTHPSSPGMNLSHCPRPSAPATGSHVGRAQGAGFIVGGDLAVIR